MLTPTGPTYRVYYPTDLQSLAPATFRRAPAPRRGGWSGLTFVILVGVVLSGVSFTALRLLNVDMTSGRTSLLAAPSSPAPTSTSPDLPPVVSAQAAPAVAPAEGSAAQSARVRHKVRGTRRGAPPALNLPRASVVPHAAVALQASAPRPAAAPDSLPPNPF